MLTLVFFSGSVRGVLPQTPAEQAGFETGDIITHANGEATSSAASLQRRILECRAGDVLSFQVLRSTGSNVYPKHLWIEVGSKGMSQDRVHDVLARARGAVL